MDEARFDRRRFLALGGAAGLAGAALAADPAQAGEGTPCAVGKPGFAAPAPLAPIHAQSNRLVDIAACTRPFRPAGPRLEAERLHGKRVVHHYGHGGSGWSLSWGSAQALLPLVLAGGDRRIAIIGCGAIGLTTARVAQRAGLRVRIYCRERPPFVRSSAATGVWSPDSRLCLASAATPDFAARWEAMARGSFRMFQSFLGLPGDPVEWHEGYALSDTPFEASGPVHLGGADEPDYAVLAEGLADIGPRTEPLEPAQHPFPVPHARRYLLMAYNLPAYVRMLFEDFLLEGGEIEQREFHDARELGGLREHTVVNATGYGARALFGDETLVPVRGQVARLMPQPEVRYGLSWRGHNLMVVPRRDGIVVQAQGEQDWDNDDDAPDRASTERALARLASLFA